MRREDIILVVIVVLEVRTFPLCTRRQLVHNVQLNVVAIGVYC